MSNTFFADFLECGKFDSILTSDRVADGGFYVLW